MQEGMPPLARWFVVRAVLCSPGVPATAAPLPRLNTRTLHEVQATMKISGKLILFALALSAAGTAQAAPRGYYPPPPPSYYAPPQNAVRLQIGGVALSTPVGYLCDAYYCDTVHDSWSALALGGDLDLAIGRGLLNFTIGAHELFAERHSGYPDIFEPSVGLTFKFLRRTQIEPRISVGMGLLFAETGDAGASFRLGGGVTFFGNAPVGLALDVVFDAGRVGGADLTQAQFLIGPEFHF
jgi:hypothetical protein